MLLALTLLVWTLATQAPSNAEVARTLYAAASYEDALTVIGRLEPSAITAEVERLRAMCFMALGRAAEATESFERVLQIAPQHRMGPDDASPRVVELFRETRRRVLPGLVRERYARGKASFDRKEFVRAIADLQEVTALIDDPDLQSANVLLADLRDLAAGFLRLAELETAAAERAAAAPRPAEPPPPAAAAASASTPAGVASSDYVVTPILVYSNEDADVRPPKELERFMPAWNPTGAMARVAEYRGQVEVIVDETGRVQQARVVRPTIPAYDLPLVGATRRWRYEPAVRQGQPVKYRLVIDFVLAPRR